MLISVAAPRHLTVTADNRHVYLVNEKGNAVTFYDYDGTTGSVVPRQILPSLPDTYTGQGQASAIILHPNETFLYATNRIHESVAIYKRDVHTGYDNTFICFILETIHNAPKASVQSNLWGMSVFFKASYFLLFIHHIVTHNMITHK